MSGWTSYCSSASSNEGTAVVEQEQPVGEDPAAESAPPAPDHDAEAESAQDRTEPSIEEVLGREQHGGAPYTRGEALSGALAADVAAQNRATVVLLAGTRDSGKTTLLASLYDQLNRGPVGGHFFLGSRTLRGFDQRCYRSREGEGPGDAAGGRTSPTAPPWLHLRLSRPRGSSERRKYELLLGDFAGEAYFQTLADGTRKVSDNPVFWRADHIGIVINGRRMATGKRQAERRAVHEILAAMLREPGAIASPSALSIVVTMWDLVVAAGDEAQDAVDETVQELVATLRQHMSADDPSVGLIQTAARSSIDSLPSGHGVADLLARWTDRPHLSIPNELSAPIVS